MRMYFMVIEEITRTVNGNHEWEVTFERPCTANGTMSERDEKELPTVLLNAIKENPNCTIGIPFSEHVPDLTAKEDILEVKAYLKKHYPVLNWDEN